MSRRGVSILVGSGIALLLIVIGGCVGGLTWVGTDLVHEANKSCDPTGQVRTNPTLVSQVLPSLGSPDEAHYWEGHAYGECRHPGSDLIIEGFLTMSEGTVREWRSAYTWRPCPENTSPSALKHQEVAPYAPPDPEWLVSSGFEQAMHLTAAVNRIALDAHSDTLYILYQAA